jgi:LacI family transcriptional regulator
MEAWLKDLPKPAAVMACNDYQAREVVWACQRLHLAVPYDVAVVGSDNDELECGLCTTPISSVTWPARRVGFEAAKALDKAMRRGTAIKPLLLPPTGVSTRQSSDSYAMADEKLAAAMQYVRDHADQRITVRDILKTLPYSRRTLEGRFLRAIGRTPREEILRTHIERAKMLLVETDLKMPIVARRCGFTPYQPFARIFRKVVGMGPAEYRKKFRQ